MKEKEVIKKSNDIFQKLLDYYMKQKDFRDVKDKLLMNKDNNDDIIIKLIES